MLTVHRYVTMSSLHVVLEAVEDPTVDHLGGDDQKIISSNPRVDRDIVSSVMLIFWSQLGAIGYQDWVFISSGTMFPLVYSRSLC